MLGEISCGSTIGTLSDIFVYQIINVSDLFTAGVGNITTSGVIEDTNLHVCMYVYNHTTMHLHMLFSK